MNEGKMIMRTRIDELRRERGMTWDALAEATGIGKPTLSRLAKGTAKTVRLEHLDALCTFFRVPVGDLLIADIVQVPLEPDPVLQERARKAAAGRGGRDHE